MEKLKFTTKTLSLIFFSLLLFDVSKDYFSYETITQFDFVNEDQLDRPAVSFCFKSKWINDQEHVVMSRHNGNLNATFIAYDNVAFSCTALFNQSASHLRMVLINIVFASMNSNRINADCTWSRLCSIIIMHLKPSTTEINFRRPLTFHNDFHCLLFKAK